MVPLEKESEQSWRTLDAFCEEVRDVFNCVAVNSCKSRVLTKNPGNNLAQSENCSLARL